MKVMSGFDVRMDGGGLFERIRLGGRGGGFEGVGRTWGVRAERNVCCRRLSEVLVLEGRWVGWDT